MLAVVMVLGVVAVLAEAEQVPCRTGQTACSGLHSLSIVNNNYFCCENGFNMQWTGQANNDTSSCVCNRHYYESDCIEGQTQCLNATNLISDGVTVKCCADGESMNSVSNSFINGVMVDYCKCLRYLAGSSGSGLIMQGGVVRPMTPSEQQQFRNNMTQFSNQLQTSMDQLRKTLDQNLNMLNLGGDYWRRNWFAPGPVGNWSRSLSDSISNTVRQGLNQFGLSRNYFDRQPAAPFQPQRPRPTWNVRDNRLQRLQRRLQRQQQRAASGTPFLERLTRNPAISDLINPDTWINQNWSGIFGNSASRRNNTAPTTSSRNITDDVSSAANPYNVLPNQNATIRL